MPYPYSGRSIQIFNHSKKLVAACFAVSRQVTDAQTNLTQYLCDAASTVHMELAQAVLPDHKKRERRLEKALAALAVVDAAVDALLEVQLLRNEVASEVLQLSATLHTWLHDWKKEN